MAAIYNTIRDPDKQPEPFTGDHFHPSRTPPEREHGIEAFGCLIGMSDYASRRAAGG